MNKRILLFVIFIAGCTAGNSSDVSSSIDTGNTNPSIENPEKLVNDIKEKANQDPQYALNEDDLKTLSEEGIASESELKSWVK